MIDPTLVDKFVRTINGDNGPNQFPDGPGGQAVILRQGTVASLNTTLNVALCNIGAGSVGVPCIYLNDNVPQVGSIVWIAVFGSSYIILGTYLTTPSGPPQFTPYYEELSFSGLALTASVSASANNKTGTNALIGTTAFAASVWTCPATGVYLWVLNGTGLNPGTNAVVCRITINGVAHNNGGFTALAYNLNNPVLTVMRYITVGQQGGITIETNASGVTLTAINTLSINRLQ